MIELTYEFGKDEFTYEPTEEEIWEVLDKFLKVLGTVPAIIILLGKVGKDKQDELEKNGYPTSTLFTNSEEDNNELLDELLYTLSYQELIDLFDLERDLRKVCEPIAYDCYTDWKLYKEDPYAYNGVSRSDFV